MTTQLLVYMYNRRRQNLNDPLLYSFHVGFLVFVAQLSLGQKSGPANK